MPSSRWTEAKNVAFISDPDGYWVEIVQASLNGDAADDRRSVARREMNRATAADLQPAVARSQA